MLPGPASSQVGMGIGLLKGGIPGAIAAFVGFTLPSAVIMAVLGLGLVATGRPIDPGLLHGLEIAVAAVVLQAVVAMTRQLAPDLPRGAVAVVAAIVCALFPGAAAQVVVLVGGGLVGAAILPPIANGSADGAASPLRRRVAAGLLVLFLALLFGLPLLASATGSPAVTLLDAFYRSGSLVFGGGHVVLPLLEAEVGRASCRERV